MAILGIDIGGSGIKGALVDVEKGALIGERFRVDTPQTLLPQDVLPAVKEVVDHFSYRGPIGVGFPAVVVDGKPVTAFTAHRIKAWIGYDVSGEITRMTGCPTTVINDADAAGIAENAFGAGKDQTGTVILLTLGTGVGSALFTNHILIPNTEFGKIYLRDRNLIAERFVASAAKERLGLKWRAWARGIDEYLHQLEALFTPQLFIIGGGISKKHEKFVPHLTTRTPVVPAKLRNHAGIIGAAMAGVM